MQRGSDKLYAPLAHPDELLPLLPDVLEEELPELPDEALDELPEAGDLLEGAMRQHSHFL